MEMPKPTKEHERLHALAGKWQGTERMYPSPWDPQGGDATMVMENRIALDGFVVVGDYQQKRSGRRTFEGHAVFTFDAARGAYLMYWFDTMGLPPSPAGGGWKDGKLTFEDKNPMGQSRYTYTFPGKDQLALEIEISLDGTRWQPFLSGTYKRS